MKGLLVLLLTLSFLSVQANDANLSGDERTLEEKIRLAQSKRTDMDDLQRKYWRSIAGTLAGSEDTLERCMDISFENISSNYMVSLDENGVPCRVYDLSFPTLNGMMKKKSLRLPVQDFKASDYLAWVNGDYEKVFKRVDDFKGISGRIPDEQLSPWVKKIEFKNSRLLLESDLVSATGLPREFLASDIEMGKGITLTQEEVERAQAAIDSVIENGGFALTPPEIEAWYALLENPNEILKKIKFQWSDLDKVYEIVMMGQFLPIKGPIVLADRGRPYKVATEIMLRNVIRNVLNRGLRLVPANAAQIVGYVFNELFDFVEDAYAYQMNQLEWTLNATLNADVNSNLSEAAINRLLNLTMAGHADLMNEYILSIVQGKPFAWDRFEDLGRRTRYEVEKSRMITSVRQFNELSKKMKRKFFRKDRCDLQKYNQHFAICKTEEHHKLFSLLSDHKIFFFDLGPAMIFRYDKPNRVLMMRGVSYALSAATQLAPLPFAATITKNLAEALKSYAKAGILDEAFLKGMLTTKIATGRVMNPDEVTHHHGLFLQNLNPFLVKSVEGEAKMIRAQRGILMDRQGGTNE